jgi:hypothetical protein
VVNAYENQAFHDELEFLYTQKHKMELDWEITLGEERTAECKNNYAKTHKLLTQEIAAFEKDNNRAAFTRSCMQTSNFKCIQEGREKYKLTIEL